MTTAKNNEPVRHESGEKIRIFPSGATRDTEKGKLNYIGALSPKALKIYVNYIGKHRIQSDGNLRDWDNWKKGFPRQVCLESLARHFMNLWMLHEGIWVKDNHGAVDIKDAICGIIFNAFAYLEELTKERHELKEGQADSSTELS